MTIFLITHIQTQALGTLVPAKLQEVHWSVYFFGIDAQTGLLQISDYLRVVHYRISTKERNKKDNKVKDPLKNVAHQRRYNNNNSKTN